MTIHMLLKIIMILSIANLLPNFVKAANPEWCWTAPDLKIKV